MLTTARAHRGLRPPNQPQHQSSTLNSTCATTPTNSAKCSRAARRGRELQKGLARRPAARCLATQLTGVGVAAQTSLLPPTWEPPLPAGGGQGGAASGSPRHGRLRAVHVGTPALGAAARGAPASVQTVGSAAGGGVKGRPPHHRGSVPSSAAQYSRWLHGSKLRAAQMRTRAAGPDREAWRGRRVAEKRGGNLDTASEALRSVEPGGATASPGELAPGAFQTGQSAPAHGKEAGPPWK